MKYICLKQVLKKFLVKENKSPTNRYKLWLIHTIYFVPNLEQEEGDGMSFCFLGFN